MPSVVHGLASSVRPGEATTRVVVARGTYPDRYDDAEVIEYDQVHGTPIDRYADLFTGRLFGRRPRAARVLAAPFVDQHRWEPGVVFAHNAPQAVPAVDARRHVPVVWVHNQLFRTYGRREAGRVLAPAAAVLCVSDFIAGEVRDRLPATVAERVVTLRNGVDTTFFRPGPSPGRDEGLEVLFVGRTLPFKGAHVLVEALQILRRPHVTATIVGSAGFTADAPLTDYERELRRSGAGVGVTFLPFAPRAEIARRMGSADVVVVPSVWPDPFPLTVLEGFASGSAVIASRIGGIPEAVGTVGVLVPPGDAEALADALRRLDDDRVLLGRLRSDGRKHAEANDWRARLVELQRLTDGW